MRSGIGGLGWVSVTVVLGLFFEPVPASACPRDSVPSGTVCMDKYEASLWKVPPTANALIEKIQQGEVTLADLISPRYKALGVMQVGLTDNDLEAAGCPPTANGCVSVYAVSIRGVMPATFVNWFQAAAAARNSLKRLPTNQEWQVAALGTPYEYDICNLTDVPTVTGSRAGCVSDVGTFDMNGNVSEWVAEWVPRSPVCGSWGDFAPYVQCLAGAATNGAPGALVRRGVFSVDGGIEPHLFAFVGFRAAR